MLAYLPSASHLPKYEYQPPKNLNESNHNKNWQVLATHTHVTEVKGVHSGLYEERIVWGQVRLELSFLVLCFIVQLWKKKKERHKIKITSKEMSSPEYKSQFKLRLRCHLLFVITGGQHCNMQRPCETHFPLPQSQCDHWVYSGPSECSVLFILQRDGSPVSMVPTERQLADVDDWAHFRGGGLHIRENSILSSNWQLEE